MRAQLHYSPNLAGYAPCRARRNCPFGGSQAHLDLHQIANDYKRDLALPEEQRRAPVVYDNGGQPRTYKFHQDGSYELGKRTYTADGELVAAPSSIRVRKARALKRLDEFMSPHGELDAEHKREVEEIFAEFPTMTQDEMDAADDEAVRLQEEKDRAREQALYASVLKRYLDSDRSEEAAAELMRLLDAPSKWNKDKSNRETMGDPWLWKSYQGQRNRRGLFGWFGRLFKNLPYFRSFLAGYKESQKALSRDAKKS